MLTLTATPIPRTLQLALTGVRELSIIATPPVDRLAVRTFVSPFDPLIVREALLRERYRGGQASMSARASRTSPASRISSTRHVPEVKVAVAHGQMPPTELEDVMTAFYDGKYDVLLSTTIVESGLDIPTANTLIVHRADMFGLAQLYQLRGRVGRSKMRAYALFTLPARAQDHRRRPSGGSRCCSRSTRSAPASSSPATISTSAAPAICWARSSPATSRRSASSSTSRCWRRRWRALKAGITAPVADKWSPQITIGTPVLIPEDYVADLPVRLALYRRLAELEDEREIEAFGAELIDRFGPLPEEVEHLLQIVAIKALCRRANVEKIEAGPKGAVIVVPRQHLRQSGGPGRLHPRAGHRRAGAAGHEGRVLRRLGGARAAPQGHHRDPAQPGRHRRARQGGVIVPPPGAPNLR